MFRRNKKPNIPKRPEEVPADAFAAVPQRAKNVEAKEDEQGKLYLRFKVASRHPTDSWISRKLNVRRYRRFHLDQVGKSYWNLSNGKRTLEQIEQRMRKQYGWNQEDSRHAILSYTMTLLERKLIEIDLSHRKPIPTEESE